MVVKDIIPLKELTTEQMCFVVEQYILDVKGAVVEINLDKRGRSPLSPLTQESLLITAYNDACKYFIQKLNIVP